MSEISYFEAIYQAHQEEMQRDERIVMIGEDISLYTKSGIMDGALEDRIFSTPIAENGFTGMGVSAPLTGLRPVVDLTISSFVYWAMDIYPDLPVACGVMKPTSIFTRCFDKLNRLCLLKADRVIVLGRCMSQLVANKGVPSERLEIINVWSDSKAVVPVDRNRNRYRKRWKLDGAFVVMYSGNIGLGHDVSTLCEAIRILAGREDIRFVLVGEGKRKREVEDFIAKHGLGNVQMHSYQPRTQLDESLSLGDLHLISMKESISGIMVPSKLYGIMAAARPAVFIGHPDSEIAKVLTENHCGYVVRCGDSKALANIIEELAGNRNLCREMGRRARQAMIDHYDCSDACAAWEKLLLHVAAENNRQDLITPT